MLSRACAFASVALALSILTSTGAMATAQRTFVAPNGSDANPCSIAAPCRGFAAAVNKTNAGGEVIVQDSAGYGAVTITKPISIISPPGIYAGVSVVSGNGVTVNAPGATVVLRGLSINGQGGANGILVQQATRVRIESCVVSGMGAVGIYHAAGGAEMIVLDTIVRDNVDGVALVATDASIMLDRVHSEHNQNTGFYIAPTTGSVKVSATIVDSVLAYNGVNGVWADTVGDAATIILVERSVMSNNGNDGFLASSGAGGSKAQVTLTRSAISSNGADGILIDGEAPGLVDGTVSENAVLGNGGDGIQVISTGNVMGAQIVFSANSSASNQSFDVSCKWPASILSHDNNLVTSAIQNIGGYYGHLIPQ